MYACKSCFTVIYQTRLLYWKLRELFPTTAVCERCLTKLVSKNLEDYQRAELETYIQTQPSLPTTAGLNDLYSATQKNLGTETKLQQQLKQELEM